MTYYDIPKILEIIKQYNIDIKTLAERRKEYASVGVTQYGIESTLPKAQGVNSDVVANEAIRHVEDNMFFANMETDIKYLQDRWDRVTNETDAQILSLRLDGLSAREIGRILRCTDRTIHVRLRRIAETIKSYPQ